MRTVAFVSFNFLLKRPHRLRPQAVITCGILEHMFSANLASLRDEAKKLEQELARWKESLPEYLQITTEEEMRKATPHCLTLRMQWECAKIVLQLPL